MLGHVDMEKLPLGLSLNHKRGFEMESESVGPVPIVEPPSRIIVWSGMVFALVFPTIVTWVYFVLMASSGKAIQGLTYSSLKCLQFLFPVVWTVWVLKQRVRWARPRAAGIVAGIAFGLAVTVGGWLVYRGWLCNSAFFVAAAEKIRAKVAGFGLDSVWAYAVMGLFYSLVHSFLEEYYWRWFVFGQLRRLVPLRAATVVSSTGFMAHHVIVLGTYFGALSWMTVLLSAAVAIGGAFWAWLYERSGSLYGPWVSHMLVDAGIFLVGFDLMRGML
jgi:membrane protease YdiL (CAAX protease family)